MVMHAQGTHYHNKNQLQVIVPTGGAGTEYNNPRKPSYEIPYILSVHKWASITNQARLTNQTITKSRTRAQAMLIIFNHYKTKVNFGNTVHTLRQHLCRLSCPLNKISLSSVPPFPSCSDKKWKLAIRIYSHYSTFPIITIPRPGAWFELTHILTPYVVTSSKTTLTLHITLP